jgi:hypothetical protein
LALLDYPLVSLAFIERTTASDAEHNDSTPTLNAQGDGRTWQITGELDAIAAGDDAHNPMHIVSTLS